MHHSFRSRLSLTRGDMPKMYAHSFSQRERREGVEDVRVECPWNDVHLGQYPAYLGPVAQGGVASLLLLLLAGGGALNKRKIIKMQVHLQPLALMNSFIKLRLDEV